MNFPKYGIRRPEKHNRPITYRLNRLPFTAENNWFEFRDDQTDRSGPILFLDRDGVIIEDHSYISSPDNVEPIAGSFASIRQFQDVGFRIVIVSNQSGIGRGYFGWDDALAVQRQVEKLAQSEGIEFDGVLMCPHHEDAGKGNFKLACNWRKPGTGMIDEALRRLSADVAACCIVGDRTSDLLAGISAGIGRIVHVSTGHGLDERGDVEALARQHQIELAGSLADVEPAGADGIVGTQQ